MRTVLTLVLAGSLATWTACSRAQAPAAEVGDGDGNLARILSAYVVEFLKRNPTTNTYLGGGGLDPSLVEVDGRLRDHSATALELEDRWLEKTAQSIESVGPETLSGAVGIDRDVALAQIRFLLRQHRTRRYQERALDTYVGEPFRAVDWQLQGMTRTGATTYGTPEEWALVVRRVSAIPGYLDTARGQLMAGVASLRVPDRRMLQRDGLDTAEANAKYFAETLPALASDRLAGADRERLLGELRRVGAQAAEAYGELRSFVLRTFFDEGTPPKPRAAYAGNRFAMGEEEYNWALANNLRIESKAGQLFDQAWPIVEDTRRQMIELARSIGARRGWPVPADGASAVRAVFDELSKDYPRSDTEMVAWYRDAAFRLVEYGRRTGVFDVPADYSLDVVETPPPLQASIDGAAYYPAPPFKQSGVGRFYVTPTHNDRAALQSNNRAALADLAAHEGFPGHDWYYKVLTAGRVQLTPVRWLTPGAVEDSSSMWQDSIAAEGWGLYAEALMAEAQPGAPGGFYTPEERLYQLQGKLYRDLRVRIDTGIHTQRMEYDEAVTLYSEIVDFLPGSCADARSSRSDAKRASCESAERAIFRYSKWPTQAITYRIGKDQIYGLREEARAQLGEKFSPMTFHLAFIRQGTIPPNYFREALLNELRLGATPQP